MSKSSEKQGSKGVLQYLQEKLKTNIVPGYWHKG